MISEKALEIALRKTPVTDAEWVTLLDERHGLIRPRLKQIACAKLGDTHYSAPGISFTLFEFVESLKEFTGTGILETRGIFGVTRRRDSPDGKNLLHAFGLTCSDSWVYLELEILEDNHATLISYPLLMPEDFSRLNIDYRCLFNLLGTAVEKWMRQREKRFREAQDLHRRFAIERELIDQLQSNPEKD